ncbi:DUF4238 domain-containing protein [Chitinophaga eiseniae]|uniref:DUF4238 domain-containing protein n=1 Tax=Chitinophaga eiseniae TaxID=634771 RepID=A0A847SM54_9BACT|nr:DUF4238 domain-containing protein [Chitinophaga eiseniae]NLR83051.1 DUF4238 domain-containing protein [Chitinophaga eiseniae]
MTQNLVKRQHYVPRTYLKNFASKQVGDEYFVKALSIEDARPENIFDINIKNVCLERNLYTLPGETAEEKMLLEKFYSDEIEQHYNSIYALLTDPSKTTITHEERELIISTVVTTFYRTTKWINQHNDLLKRVYTQMFSLCQQAGKDYFLFEGIKVSIKDKTPEELLAEYKVENRPGQVITQLEVALKLIEARIKSDNIFVSKLADDDCEFITSDNPVVLQNIKGGHITPFDPSNIMKLPLDKKHMLFLMPDADEEARKLIVRHNVTGLFCRTEKLISNAEQFQKADRFILGDEQSLMGYLQTKDLAERPLSEEEIKNMTSFDDYIKKGKELGLF